jgi:cytochrome oxidase Cu insertion factor (SCO1/SenC/PrrC family)
VSAQQPSVPATSPLRRLRWIFWGVALVVGVAAGALIGVLRSHADASPPIPTTVLPAVPAAQWAAGELRAPDFSLTDQAGKPISLARFRGRPVLLTFIDPLCRNLCPTEAKILAAVENRFPSAQRPAIVAVSVNQWGDARHVLLQDRTKWKLPADWHWAVGAPAALKQVWKDYSIGVTDAPKIVTGITVHNISHTEASFLIDASGGQRALWLYPFRAADVARTIRSVSGAAS